MNDNIENINNSQEDINMQDSDSSVNEENGDTYLDGETNTEEKDFIEKEESSASDEEEANRDNPLEDTDKSDTSSEKKFEDEKPKSSQNEKKRELFFTRTRRMNDAKDTRIAAIPKSATEIYKTKQEKKKSWFEPAGYTESVSTIHNIIKTIIYVIFITVVGCFLAYYAITRINDLYAFVKPTDEVEIVIPENATVNEVADILYQAGIIEYPSFFKFYAELKDASERYNFKAGTYVVNPMMNYDQLFIWLEGKPTQTIERITIPEGFTVNDIIDLFVEKGYGTREGFINAIQNYEFENEFLKELTENEREGVQYRLEGFLYPDTYDVYTDKSEAYYIYKLLDRFEEIYSEKFKERANALGLSLNEVITIASMIEKETKIQNEYEIVSSVFHNRLNNSFSYPKLESDATVVYAIELATGSRVTELSAEDLKIDSPYNTYTNDGLPPGPISCPGYEAIVSALYPEKSSYYFFVSTIEGETYFASTLAQHEKNIATVKKLNDEYLGRE